MPVAVAGDVAAVSDTDWPTMDGFAEEVNATPVGAATTTWVTVLEELPAYVESPPYWAINNVVPAGSVPSDSCAWPLIRVAVLTILPFL